MIPQTSCPSRTSSDPVLSSTILFTASKTVSVGAIVWTRAPFLPSTSEIRAMCVLLGRVPLPQAPEGAREPEGAENLLRFGRRAPPPLWAASVRVVPGAGEAPARLRRHGSAALHAPSAAPP